ncbi:MAG: replication-associated recombination protein A [Peptococcaceae bacterium]|nr:replication-associated recombination protein A [Peptococcaceae bacterium]
MSVTDLFSQALEHGDHIPLADRMRPRTLDEFVGQEHIVGPGRLLRRAIEVDRLGSLIFFGPPGSGKTTLAYIISKMTRASFRQVNAVSSGVKELRQVITEAEDALKYYRRKTIVFVDECHAFNKSQQDVLLPAIEKGIIVFIGSTTENPYFEMNKALLSRSRIFQLKELSSEDIKKIITRALQDKERGLGKYKVVMEPEALDHLVNLANGDARSALNALELAVTTTTPANDGYRHITVRDIEDSMQRRVVKYDKSGDQHYDIISAFIKSIRGSDPDAALYWYARMTQAGEDQRFIVRRLIVHASEDVGMADPLAMLMAHAAWNALEAVGMPEARIPIAQCIIYLATAPKSNSVIEAIDQALSDVEKLPHYPVPPHLRDTHYHGAKELGHSGYLYPHNFPGHWVQQQYMPDNLVGKKYYKPSDQGRERKMRKE